MKLAYTSKDKTWYKGLQQDNTRRFKKLTKGQQKQLRNKEYRNVGKKNVKKSHDLLNKWHPEVQVSEYPKQLSLFDDILEPRLAEVLKHVSNEPTFLDVVIQKTGLLEEDVSCILLELQILELVTRLPGQRYQKINL